MVRVLVLKFQLFLMLLLPQLVEAQVAPKREFRGAWIQTMFQGEYSKMSVPELKADLTSKLDKLQDLGINALIFQVRPESDAWYKSDLEPWSRFLTGKQGAAPEGNFDPMAFLITECHKRCIEFHAWLNPYRAASSNGIHLTQSHVYRSHPEWFFSYNNYIFFNPGEPECLKFLCSVVHDIVSRYDVDAIHIDDYFYPYPSPGNIIPDSEQFAVYGTKFNNIEDWRRDNVNHLIYSMSKTIKNVKPWVRFGVSPFGIYRNSSSSPDGSATNGLQNFDNLYADILLWVKRGWVDYNIPQIYWEIGHPQADYSVLSSWWANHKGLSHLYYGEDVARTMKANDLTEKMRSLRAEKSVSGVCFWPANELFWNNGGVVDSLKSNYFKTPALIPAYTMLSKKKPEMVSKITISKDTKNELTLSWLCCGDREEPLTARYFVLYAFNKGEKINLDRSDRIIGITPYTNIKLSSVPKNKMVFIVTSINRYNNESSGRKFKFSPGEKKKL